MSYQFHLLPWYPIRSAAPCPNLIFKSSYQISYHDNQYVLQFPVLIWCLKRPTSSISYHDNQYVLQLPVLIWYLKRPTSSISYHDNKYVLQLPVQSDI